MIRLELMSGLELLHFFRATAEADRLVLRTFYPITAGLYSHQRHSALLRRIQARARAAPRYLGLSTYGSRNSH